MKKFLVVIILLGLMMGCDSQTPNVKFINGLDVLLYFDPAVSPSPEYLDGWYTSGDGMIISSAVFGYFLTVETYDGENSVPVSGIRVDCYVEDCDPTGSSYNIWKMPGPGLSQFGFVSGQPPDGTTWSPLNNHATVRTNSSGACAFFIGLGDPTPQHRPLDWIWPYGCSTMVSTGVKLRFVVRRYPNPIQFTCHSYFLRGQCAGFWLPEGMGVTYTSYSSLEEPPWIWPLSVNSNDIEKVRVIVDANGPRKRDLPPNVYPFDDSCSGSSGDYTANWLLEDAYWAQMAYGGGGWSWDTNFDILKGLVSPDPMIEGDANSILSMSEPYAFWLEIIPEIWGNWGAKENTVILESLTSEGDLVSWMPVKVRVDDYVGTDLVRYWSDYIIPIDTSTGEGRYMDWWGFHGVFIKAVPDGYLNIKIDDLYGDFNFDSIVNFQDYLMLFDYMGQTVEDNSFDILYDGTQDGVVDINDFGMFIGNWLKER